MSDWIKHAIWWHIYPIGVLFGLGFDTATEVGLLLLAGTLLVAVAGAVRASLELRSVEVGVSLCS